MELSVVVPLYNEEGSLTELVEKLLAAIRPLGLPFELVLVDDGSRDGTARVLSGLQATVPELVAVLLRRNYGQTAAMSAGFDVSRGAVIITLDGDLQNDPADIPLLLETLGEGYDLVSGWRHQRQDAALSRLLPSRLANQLIAAVTGVRLHDYGCSLKAYRREVVEDLNLYGELHRFLPALAFIEGARIGEVKVQHHARRHGADGSAHGVVHEAVPDPADACVRPGRPSGHGGGAGGAALVGRGETGAGHRYRRSTAAVGSADRSARRRAALLLRSAG